MRRSPIFHHVHSHVRSDGDRVHAYTRGEGSRRAYLRRSPYVTRTVLPKEVREGVWCDKDEVIKKDHCGKCSDKESFSKSHELREYTVDLKYNDGTKERIKVQSHSPEESLHDAMNKVSPRHRQMRPTEVVSKNLLGEIIGKIAAWGVGGVKKAAHVYRETRYKTLLQSLAKKGSKEAMEELETLQVQEAREKRRMQRLKEEY